MVSPGPFCIFTLLWCWFVSSFNLLPYSPLPSRSLLFQDRWSDRQDSITVKHVDLGTRLEFLPCHLFPTQHCVSHLILTANTSKATCVIAQGLVLNTEFTSYTFPLLWSCLLLHKSTVLLRSSMAWQTGLCCRKDSNLDSTNCFPWDIRQAI